MLSLDWSENNQISKIICINVYFSNMSNDIFTQTLFLHLCIF